MKISKSIILPDWEKIEDFEQTSNILKQITEALKDHNLQNYEDAVTSFRQLTTGRIQSQDGETYFDLDSGVIKGEIVFRPGSSGLDNVEEAKPNDWDNAFRLANAVKGDDDFTLISGSKILTGSIAVGAFNSDVVARMFSSGASQEAIEGWMKSGDITYIDGNKIYTGSIVVAGLNADVTDRMFTDDATKTNIEAWKHASDVTYIDGGKIYTGSITAEKITVDNLAAIEATLGNVTSGTISSSKINLTTSTDYSLYFTSSGAYLYDGYSAHGAPSLTFYKDGYARLGLVLGSSSGIECSANIFLQAGSAAVKVYTSGVLQLPNLSSDPSGVAGGICMVNGQLKYWNGSAWTNA